MLFSTPHGSHLYGLATPTSDYDTYTVLDKQRNSSPKYAHQTINGLADDYVIDFDTWLLYCSKGTPQALEAMFSQVPTHDDIAALRAGYRVGTAVIPGYLHVIKESCYTETFKNKRHALRLAMNLKTLREFGRFDPAMTEEEKAFANEHANMEPDDVYELAKSVGLS